MARPINDEVLQDVTTTGASNARFTKGHRYHTLFVIANGAVSGTITVALEISPDGKNWHTLNTFDGTLKLSESDFNGSGVASLSSDGCAAELIRVNVRENTDNVSLSVWVMSQSHGGTARRGGGAGEV